ncbi:MAG: class I poly(R)-hydroxyalkanoic acid synthase, partial [Alphaproteobacteria bacterium]|nr:class I poly(R)-hydroxyalkanoic acid synthase [Alphaproteobacteria bacterium]
ASLLMMGNQIEPIIAPPKEDRRFKDAAWSENLLFDFIKQSYLLTSRWMQSQAHEVGDIDKHTRDKLDFFTRQFVDAMAPTNFAMTNPEVLRTTIESGGENLVKGLANLLKDLEKGKGKLAISMTDTSAFSIGENVAISPGKVVFQTDMMQLIQYNPTTTHVAKRPLMIIPPWINKYYILDLASKNSLVKWAVEQGHTVFMISWVNPGAEHGDKNFENYMSEGPLAALDAIAKATGERDIQALGYCLGGTLLACTLSWMKAKGDDRIKSATFLTTLLDFTEPGELGVFIDEQQLTDLETRMKKTGFLEGQSMSMSFNMLRDNDLIWSFVVNNYLLGKDPFPFDLLYWNSDSTRMPAAMHSFYLRKMYLENKLVQAGGISLMGVPIDLGRIDLPIMMVSTREDHIAPWKSTFAGTRLFGRKPIFILAGSGHIAGVVNPPAANKYQYWVNSKMGNSPDEWLAAAEMRPGSWWTEWAKYLTEHSGGQVPARVPGAGGLAVIEDAPGSYVRVRLGEDESAKPAAAKAPENKTAQAKPTAAKSPTKPKSASKKSPSPNATLKPKHAARQNCAKICCAVSNSNRDAWQLPSQNPLCLTRHRTILRARPKQSVRCPQFYCRK